MCVAAAVAVSPFALLVCTSVLFAASAIVAVAVLFSLAAVAAVVAAVVDVAAGDVG